VRYRFLSTLSRTAHNKCSVVETMLLHRHDTRALQYLPPDMVQSVVDQLTARVRQCHPRFSPARVKAEVQARLGLDDDPTAPEGLPRQPEDGVDSDDDSADSVRNDEVPEQDAELEARARHAVRFPPVAKASSFTTRKSLAWLERLGLLDSLVAHVARAWQLPRATQKQLVPDLRSYARDGLAPGKRCRRRGGAAGCGVCGARMIAHAPCRSSCPGVDCVARRLMQGHFGAAWSPNLPALIVHAYSRRLVRAPRPVRPHDA
jgi:hypothetical protein